MNNVVNLPAPARGPAFPFASERGFSIVDSMVGLTIGMIAILVVMQAASLFQQRRTATVAGANANDNGVMAAHILERDLRQAGFGLAPALGCTLERAWKGVRQNDLKLVPVEITPGGSAPDQLQLMFATRATTPEGAHLTANHISTDTVVSLSSTFGLTVGDEAIFYEAGHECILAEITQIDSANQARHESAGSSWNPATPLPLTAAYSQYAVLIDVGHLGMSTYQLKGDVLVHSSYQSSTNAWVDEPLVNGVLSMKAQYGFDTRSGMLTDRRVTSWSNSMLDADASGVAGDPGDLQRLVAVRLALLMQAGARERGTTCTATSNPPSWMAGQADGSLAATAFDMSAVPDWQCYRYQVFAMTVPLRNMLWQ